jgi:GNAT superfamily N-acetyltransferase
MEGEEAMEIHPSSGRKANLDIKIRPLLESDLSVADRIMRLAFGTFLGMPDPTAIMGDTDYIRTRWRADPEAAFGAEINGQLVGSNFASHWGSVGFFGPLTIHPNRWDQGAGKRLMAPILDCFTRWGTKHSGLFTFAHSQKHVGLYQKFGFWPRFLTAIMSKPASQTARQPAWSKFSEVSRSEQEPVLQACRQATDAIYEGLDVTLEMRNVANQGLGDTVLLWDEGKLAGLAVCHYGGGTEAGSGNCYVKFGAVCPGPAAEQNFEQLLDACEAMALEKSLSCLAAGVNTARVGAYRVMLKRGFRTTIQGVAMQRPNEPGYNRADVYLIDDWR